MHNEIPIEQAAKLLSRLVGERLHDFWRALNLVSFEFGETVQQVSSFGVTPLKPFVARRFELHVQCPWCFLRSKMRIISSRDIEVITRANRQSNDPRTEFDLKRSDIVRMFPNGLVMTSAAIDSSINPLFIFEDGYELQIDGMHREDVENWRLLDRVTTNHLIVKGGTIHSNFKT